MLHEDDAGSRARPHFGIAFVFLALVGAVHIVLGLSVLLGGMELPVVRGWLALTVGLLVLALTLGAWSAAKWAWLGFGILGTLIAANYAIALLREPTSGPHFIWFAFWLWVAVYAFWPSTRAGFARWKSSGAGQ